MGALRLFQKHLRIMGYSNTISCFVLQYNRFQRVQKHRPKYQPMFCWGPWGIDPSLFCFSKGYGSIAPSRSPGYAFSSLPSLRWMAHGCWSSRGARPWSGCHVSVNSGDHFQRLAWVCPRLLNSLGKLNPQCCVNI